MTVEGSRMHPIWMRLSTSNMETQYFKLCHYITVYAKGSISCNLTIVVKLLALYYMAWTLVLCCGLSNNAK